MDSKSKHRTTVVDPDEISVIAISRSQRRNKTVLKTRKHKREPSSSEQFINQKQIKTIVEGKIQELHRKMKQFFSQQRKTHLQQIAPDMQQLKQLIFQLRQQLNRPKSMQEIQREKHELLKRKNKILGEIEKINKKVKENKMEYVRMKLEGDEVEREVISAVATLKKYRHKMERRENENNRSKKNSESQLEESGVSNSLSQQNRKANNSNNNRHKNLQRILDDSLIQQENNHPSLNQLSTQRNESSKQSNNKHNQIENNNSGDTDRVHITEVAHFQCKLPLIANVKRFSAEKLKNNFSQKRSSVNNNINNNMNNDSKDSKFVQIGSNRNSETKLKKKPVTHNPLQTNIQGSKSSTSFAALISSFDNSLTKNLSSSNLHSQFYRIKAKRSLPFDLSLQLQKIQQFVNREKWTQVDRLFEEIDDNNVVMEKGEGNSSNSNNNNIDGAIIVKEGRNDKTKSSAMIKQSSPVNNLSEMLMDQLRKVQFDSYKEKGYHQGLKDKTYQIKVQLKTIFKNFSPDEFFSKVMGKKSVQKQLLKVLENSIVG